MFRKLILVSAISVALLPGGAAALGLGAMRAQSALNQPFVGEIDLLDARPDELDTVKVRLASPEAFANVGAERFHYLTKLRFAPQLSARGRPVVLVTSREPVREPYMDLLVEVIWPTGRLVREYTVLLDLPATKPGPAPAVSPPPVRRQAAARPAAQPAPRRPARRAEQKTPPPAAPKQSKTVSADGYPLRYGPVPSGKGLWRVARGMAPAGATVPQTAMALYRNNQHAFVAGDINRLLMGQILEIPSKAELLALDPTAAEAEFQTALAGRKVRRTPLTDEAAIAAQEGPTQLRIAGTGADQAAAESASGEPSGADAGGIDDIEQELLLVREAGESTRQETDHLHGRIRQLESQLADIQRLLTLRNQQLAQLQSLSAQADGVETLDASDDQLSTAGTSADAALAAVDTQGLDGADRVFDVDPAEAPDADTDSSAGEQGADADGGQPAADAAGQGETAIALTPEAGDEAVTAPIAEAGEPMTPAGQPDQPKAPADAGAAAPETQTAAVLPPDKVEQPSFLDSLPLPLPWLGAGAATLGLGGLLAFMMLRRRRQAGGQEEKERVILAGAADPGLPESDESEWLSTGLASDAEPGQLPVVDEDVLPASFDAAFPMEEDADDGDVLSEADIYIAYGRYQEAEALLKEELSKYPGRADLQFKLADAYHGVGDGAALQALSDQMRHAGADRQDPEQWQRLESMQQALESRGDGLAAPASVSGLAAQSPSMPDAAASALPADMFAQDAEAGVQPDSDGRYSLDISLDLPMDDSASVAEPSPELEGGSAGLAEIEDLDLDILSDQSGTVGNAADDSGLFDLELPDSMASGLPSDAEDARVQIPGEAVAVDESVPAHRQETADELASYLAGTADASAASRIRELTDDDLSSELLSSQWQMDSGAWDEVGTKMELALAYMDMDDHDGARAILEEIKREGNDEQRAEAGELLAKLP